MSVVLCKPTLIDCVERPVGAVIDKIATPGEIESLLRTGRAKRTAKPKAEPNPEPDPEPEAGEERAGNAEDGNGEPSPILTPGSDATTGDTNELAELLDELEFPANVFDALAAAGITDLAKLVEALNRENYSLSEIKGIGKKTEAKLRAALSKPE